MTSKSITKFPSIIAFIFMTGQSEAADKQVIEGIVDGQSITTSNSVANVEVRAQSLGPGACAVEFSTGNNSIGFLAVPFSYSPWTKLASHIGSATFKIGIDAKCDTGVLAQVRYFR